MQKKQYTTLEKIAYYEKRAKDKKLTAEQREYARSFVSGARFAFESIVNRSCSVAELEATIKQSENSPRFPASFAKGLGEKAEREFAMTCAALNGDKEGEIAGLQRLREIKLQKQKQAAAQKLQLEARQRQAKAESDILFFMRTAGGFKTEKEMLDFVNSVGSRRVVKYGK